MAARPITLACPPVAEERLERHRVAHRRTLAAGEAFFQVAKDSARPFFVETAAGSVRVTGTQFNVRTAPAGQPVPGEPLPAVVHDDHRGQHEMSESEDC